MRPAIVRFGIALLALLPLALAAGCNQQGNADPEAIESESVIVPVTTKRVVAEPFTIYISATGKLRAKKDIVVVSRIGGEVLEVPVKEGDFVAEGDLLVRLDDEELRFRVQEATAAVALARANLSKMMQLSRPQQIEQIKANLESARASFEKARVDHERFERLFREGVISKDALDSAATQYTLAEARFRAAQQEYALVEEGARTEDRQIAQAQVDQAESALLLAQKQLSYCRIESPIAGRVASVSVQVGNTIAPSTPLMNVVDLDTVEIKVGLTPEEIIYAKEGDPVAFTVDALAGETFQGVITYSGIKIDERTGAFPVLIEATNEDGRLRPGMVARVRFVREHFDDAVVVSRDAVVEKLPDWVVYVVDNGVAVERPIQIRSMNDGQVVVLQGLKPGEELVVRGQNRLENGTRVSVEKL